MPGMFTSVITRSYSAASTRSQTRESVVGALDLPAGRFESRPEQRMHVRIIIDDQNTL